MQVHFQTEVCLEHFETSWKYCPQGHLIDVDWQILERFAGRSDRSLRLEIERDICDVSLPLAEEGTGSQRQRKGSSFFLSLCKRLYENCSKVPIFLLQHGPIEAA